MSLKQNTKLKIADFSLPRNQGTTSLVNKENNVNFKMIQKSEAEGDSKIENKSEVLPKAKERDNSIHKENKKANNTYTGVSGFQSLEGSQTMVMNSPLYTMEYSKYVKSSSSYLLCLLGPEELVGRYWVIEDNKKMIIGRNRRCDISIQSLSVSKEHLYLRSDSNGFFIEDKKSTNGTFVNGKGVETQKEIQVSDNSKIKLGNIVFKVLEKGNPEIISMIENFEKIVRDPLTGVGNKFMLNKRAEELFIQSRQRNIPLSLIIFDIDHFKKVNDTYGHLAGDYILKEVVKSVKVHFRSNDLFVRCGGEEFCIIMQSLIDRAERAIEKARKHLEIQVFQYKEHEIKVTISGGVSCQSRVDRKWKEIYERADKLLYKAKTTGRNKIFASI